MKDNGQISLPDENSKGSVFRPPILDDRMVLTTSGPVRDALERQRENMKDEREVVFERRFLGHWVYKDE